MYFLSVTKLTLSRKSYRILVINKGKLQGWDCGFYRIKEKPRPTKNEPNKNILF